MIDIKSLRIDYETVTAVRDLDLSLSAGEIYGLVGPNGAGKTSTLKALEGIIEPTYGEIKLDGIDLELHPEEALKLIGFMPDFPPVYENLTVREYLDVFATAYFIEKEKREKFAYEWVTRVRLTEKWNTYVRELSRGMRQRLVLAKTLLHDPKILILDEPASGLDPMARIEMREIIKSIALKGKAVIISSHILSELSDFCTSIGIMEKGRMVVSGTIDVIREQMGATCELIIHLSGNIDEGRNALMPILRETAVIKDITEPKAGIFHALFYAHDNDAVVLLRELVHRNVPISQFYLKKADIEDIFLKIGAKEVS